MPSKGDGSLFPPTSRVLSLCIPDFPFFLSLFPSLCGALNRFYKSLWRFVESFCPRGFASTATLWGGGWSVGVEFVRLLEMLL